MKTQFGELVTGDFGDNTMTFEIEGEMTLQAGRYAIVPIDDYNQLVKKCDLANVVEQSEKLKCPECEIDYDKEEIEMFRGLCESCRDRAF